MRKKWLVIIVLSIAILLFGGLAFALRPPHKVFAPRGTVIAVEVQTVLNKYIKEQAADALDHYAGEGDLLIPLDQDGISQALADALGDNVQGLPRVLKFTGIFTDVNPDYVEIGAGFKFLFIPTGISTRLEMTAAQDEIELNLLSTHLGRISLPQEFFLNRAGKYLQLPLDASGLSTSIPMDLGDEMGITLAGLNLGQGQLLLSLHLDKDAIPEIPEETVESIKESIPEMFDILDGNPTAVVALKEIEQLLDQAQVEDKKVNPLRLMTLGEELNGALTEDEYKQLDPVINDDVKKLLEEAQQGK